MTVFHIRVDDGPENPIDVETGIYVYAAMAVPAILGLDLPIVVEIWAPDLIPEYGPYLYRIRENEYGSPIVESVVRI